jgi:hypothetical protein
MKKPLLFRGLEWTKKREEKNEYEKCLFSTEEEKTFNAKFYKGREKSKIEKKKTFCNLCLIQFNQPFQDRSKFPKSAKSCKSFLKLFSPSPTPTLPPSFLSFSHGVQFKSECGWLLFFLSQRVTSLEHSGSR